MTLDTNEPQDNPSNPNTTSYNGETMPWDEVIRTAIAANNVELHTWLPAKVIAILAPDKIAIQILLQRVLNDGTKITIPVIQNVMVQMPRGADYWIKLPIAIGDVGIALFCERSLDVWTISGGTVDPVDNRTHDLADPVFIPGIAPFSNPLLPGTSLTALTDMVIHNGSAEIYVQKAGKFKITNGSNELVDVINQVLTQLISVVTDLSTAVTATAIGPQPLSCAPQLVTISTQLTSIQTLLLTLKGI